MGLNNLQWLICHKTKPNQTKPIDGILIVTTTPRQSLSGSKNEQFVLQLDELFIFAFNLSMAEFTSILWVIILHE